MAQKQTSMSSKEYRQLKPKKRQKYGAVRTKIDGIKFDSKGEALRWLLLRQGEHKGEIVGLLRQVPFPLHVGTKKIGTYYADFSYFERGNFGCIYEDYKGLRNPLSDWKIKHAEAEYGIKILLTGPAAKRRRK